MNYGVPNQSKAGHFRTNHFQAGASDARHSPQSFTSQIVNPSFGATNPAKLVNGHSSYSQQQLSNNSLPSPARVHNIPIKVSSRFVPHQQQTYRTITPPSTNPYMPTPNRSPSSAMRYYTSSKEQPSRDFQSRIPMARQYFGNMSLTNRNRIEDSVNHYRRGSAPGLAEHDEPPREEYLVGSMSYNLRQTTPDRKEPRLVASYYNTPPSSNSYSRVEANQLPSSSRQIQEDPEEEEEVIGKVIIQFLSQEVAANIASSAHPKAMHPVRDQHQVVAETDILYSSSDEEDDVIRGCESQEADLHMHLAANPTPASENIRSIGALGAAIERTSSANIAIASSPKP
uniref:Uncharacterized protein n=1 Tax=Ditylenchus dipsaci TaxID=166011 RepID=A0A915DSI1_9BILA